jgi:hypothetical protein
MRRESKFDSDVTRGADVVVNNQSIQLFFPPKFGRWLFPPKIKKILVRKKARSPFLLRLPGAGRSHYGYGTVEYGTYLCGSVIGLDF